MSDKLQLKEAYRNLFKTADGKKVLADLATMSHYDRTHMDVVPHMTYFYEGQRSLFCYIMSMMYDDEPTEQMIEYTKHHKAERRSQMLRGTHV